MLNCLLQRKLSFDDYVSSPSVPTPTQQHAERGDIIVSLLIAS